jgi:osmoprotectant transport system substrate-binding protein
VTKSARWLLAAVFVTFSLVAAACGDDSDSSASSSAPAESTPAESTPSDSAPAESTPAAAPAIVFKALDAGGPLTTGALESGDIDIALMFSSQGVIAANSWVVLEDDKQLQPVENLVPVVRTEVVESTVGLAEVLNTVSANLTTEELSALNLKVDVDKEDPAAVAEEFLLAKGLAGEEVGSDGLAGLSITVGSANFSEQEIVANMYAIVLRNNSAQVTTKFQLGSREVVAPALETGEIDVYPEYVGSYLTFLGGEPTGDLDETMEMLIAATEPIGVTPLDPSPAADANALVVTQETADEFGLTTISDLATVTEQLTLGGPPECPERPLCILGFEEVYGLTFEV